MNTGQLTWYNGRKLDGMTTGLVVLYNFANNVYVVPPPGPGTPNPVRSIRQITREPSL